VKKPVDPVGIRRSCSLYHSHCFVSGPSVARHPLTARAAGSGVLGTVTFGDFIVRLPLKTLTERFDLIVVGAGIRRCGSLAAAYADQGLIKAA
jgi:hypothetical protein